MLFRSNYVTIGDDCEVIMGNIAEQAVRSDGVKLGQGEEVENETDPHIYNHGIVTVGEKTIIPENIIVGKNTVISGLTTKEDYPDNILESGRTLIKAGEEV